MRFFEKLMIRLIYMKIKKKISADRVEDIPDDSIREFNDIEYTNRAGKTLTMDIFEPKDVPAGVELPICINIHGGALIGGRKENSRGFCRLMAKKGYVVFSLEYRLVPDVRVYEQFDDICAGIDCVGRKLIDFDVDITRAYIVAESAGAYLALYVAAMARSKELQNAIGYKPSKMRFKALGLVSGMFYTRRKDKIGIFLSRSFYGRDKKSLEMAQYTNPEHPEIIYNIPPAYLITSKADFVERYTLDLAGELGNKGIEHKLRHMGSDPKLVHAYPMLNPYIPESRRVIDEVDKWFREHP